MNINDIIEIKKFEPVIDFSKKNLNDYEVSNEYIKNYYLSDELKKIINDLFYIIINENKSVISVKSRTGYGKTFFLTILNHIFSYQKKSISFLKNFPVFYAYINNKQYLTIMFNRNTISEIKKNPDDINKTILNNFFTFFDIELLITEYLTEYILNPENDINKKYIKFIQKSGNLNETDTKLLIKQFLYDFTEINHFVSYDIFSSIDDSTEYLRSLITDLKLTGFIILIDDFDKYENSKNILTYMQNYLNIFKQDTFIIYTSHHDFSYETENLKFGFHKFIISENQIFDYINNVLLGNKHGAVVWIEKLFIEETQDFHDISFKKGDFVNAYPLHPHTLELLRYIPDVFSKNKHIVSLIYETIINNSHYLNSDYTNIIYPDRLFDIYKPIISNSDYKYLVNKIYNYFEKELKKTFKNHGEVKTTTRIIKIIIINKIFQEDKNITLQYLIEALGIHYNNTVTINNINNLIQKLIEQTNFIYQEKDSETILKNKYYIEYKLDNHRIIYSKFNRVFDNITDYNIVLNEVISKNNNPFFDFTNFNEENSFITSIIWKNSTRNGTIYLIKNPDDINEHHISTTINNMKKTENDLYLILGVPLNLEIQKKNIFNVIDKYKNERFFHSIGFLLPEELDENEFNILKKLYVYYFIKKEIRKEYPDNDEIMDIIQEHIEQLNLKIGNIINAKYQNYSLFFAGEYVIRNKNILTNKTIDNILSNYFTQRLNNIYPFYEKISSPIEIYDFYNLDIIFEKLILENKISIQNSIELGINYLIETFLLKINFVVKDNDYYILNVDSCSNDLIDLFMNYLNTNEPVSYEDYYYNIRKSLWGIPKEKFKIIFLILVSLGYIEVLKNGEPLKALNPDIVSSKNIQIIKRQIVSEKKLKPDFNEFYSIFDININKSYIQSINTEYIEKEINRLLTKFNIQKNKIEEYFKIKTEKDFFKLTQIDKIFEYFPKIIELFEAAKQILKNNTANLDFDDKKTIKYYKLTEKIYSFLNNNLSYFEQYYFKLYNIEPNTLNNELKKDYNILNDRFSNLLNYIDDNSYSIVENDLVEFFSRYNSFYIKKHNDFYSAINYHNIREIKESDEYILINKLWDLYFFSCPEQQTELNNILSSIPKKCEYNTTFLLKYQTKCNCNLTEFNVIEINKSITRINSIIKTSIKMFKQDFQNQLNTIINMFYIYCKVNNDKEFLDIITTIFEYLKDLTDIKILTENISDTFIQKLNEFFINYFSITYFNSNVLKSIQFAKGNKLLLSSKYANQIYKNVKIENSDEHFIFYTETQIKKYLATNKINHNDFLCLYFVIRNNYLLNNNTFIKSLNISSITDIKNDIQKIYQHDKSALYYYIDKYSNDLESGTYYNKIIYYLNEIYEKDKNEFLKIFLHENQIKQISYNLFDTIVKNLLVDNILFKKLTDSMVQIKTLFIQTGWIHLLLLYNTIDFINTANYTKTFNKDSIYLIHCRHNIKVLQDLEKCLPDFIDRNVDTLMKDILKNKKINEINDYITIKCQYPYLFSFLLFNIFEHEYKLNIKPCYSEYKPNSKFKSLNANNTNKIKINQNYVVDTAKKIEVDSLKLINIMDFLYEYYTILSNIFNSKLLKKNSIALLFYNEKITNNKQKDIYGYKIKM